MPATTNPPSFPFSLASRHERRAEREMFEQLKAQLPSNVFVYYGWRWYKQDARDRPLEGEGDFVVLWPARGVILIEVKGGRVQRDQNGVWTSVDGRGTSHTIKDPFQQAEHNADELSRRFESLAELAPTVCWAVALPAVTAMPGQFELPAERLILGAHMTGLEQRLGEIFDHWSALCRGRWQTLTREATSECRTILRPEVTFTDAQPVAAVADSVERSLVELLTVEQQIHLRLLADNNRVRMRGAAGTGKTVMAKSFAEQRARAGARVLMLCHNRLLGESLHRWAKDVPNVTATYFGKYANDLLLAHGRLPGEFPDALDREATNEYWSRDVPMALFEHLASPEGIAERYDVVLVDEAQDFHTDALAAVESLARNAESHLHVFYDENQNTYRQSSERIKQFGGTLVTLTANLRNTRHIAAAACRTLENVDMVANGVAGPEPEYITLAAGETVLGAVQSLVRRLVEREEVEPARIAILTGNQMPSASGIVDGFGQWDDLRVAARSRAEGVFATRIDKAKGLEWPVVILCDVEGVAGEQMFVGITRGQTMVYVVG